MKPKYVYHGSARKLKGDMVIPRKAPDLGKNPDNILKGVYASDLKKEAIAMGVSRCKGVGDFSCGVYRKKSTKVDTIIYSGWPKQKYFYLYTLPSKTFTNKPKGSSQWVSLRRVLPKKVEKLRVEDHIHLLRKATKQEKKDWVKKYGS